MSIKQTINTALRLPVIRTTFRSKFGMSVIFIKGKSLSFFSPLKQCFSFFRVIFSFIHSLNISSCTTLGKCHVQMAEFLLLLTLVMLQTYAFFPPFSNRLAVNSPFILRCKIHKQFLIIIYNIYIFQCRSL